MHSSLQIVSFTPSKSDKFVATSGPAVFFHGSDLPNLHNAIDSWFLFSLFSSPSNGVVVKNNTVEISSIDL